MCSSCWSDVRRWTVVSGLDGRLGSSWRKEKRSCLDDCVVGRGKGDEKLGVVVESPGRYVSDEIRELQAVAPQPVLCISEK